MGSHTKIDVWMPWYPGDYLRDTRHLSCLEHGAYRQLIDAVFVAGGRLSVTDADLPRLLSISSEDWQSIEARIKAFFTIKDGIWTHKRVTEEIRKSHKMLRLQRKRTEAARAALQQKRTSVTMSVTENVTTSQPQPQPQPQSQKGGNGKPPLSEIISMEKELKRVESKLAEVRAQGTDVAGSRRIFTEPQREEMKMLKARAEELKKGLNWVA